MNQSEPELFGDVVSYLLAERDESQRWLARQAGLQSPVPKGPQPAARWPSRDRSGTIKPPGARPGGKGRPVVRRDGRVGLRPIKLVASGDVYLTSIEPRPPNSGFSPLGGRHRSPGAAGSSCAGRPLGAARVVRRGFA